MRQARAHRKRWNAQGLAVTHGGSAGRVHAPSLAYLLLTHPYLRKENTPMFRPSLTRTLSVSSLNIDPRRPAHAGHGGAAAAAPHGQDGQAAQGAGSAPARAGAQRGDATMRSVAQSAHNCMMVEIKGATNTVAPDQHGSLFAGKEVGVLSEGDTIEIDLAHATPSRRGGNQEVLRNHKADANATGKKHTWYPKFDANKERYKESDWPHIRADTFTTVQGTPASPLLAVLPARLRPRAAPVKDYQKIGKQSAADFIKGQKAYQEALHKKYSRDSILSSHRSVGFEYEFTGHSQADASSHISLARSAVHSTLFPIRFELETDSGDVVEIGMPPFIVPNKSDGSPDKAEIQAIHLTMKATMADIRTEASARQQAGTPVGLEQLLAMLKEKGIGQDWELSSAPAHADLVADMKIIEPSCKKLLGGQIYSQMNISLNGNESASAMLGVRRRYAAEPNEAEQSAMGMAHAQLEDAAIAHLPRATLADGTQAPLPAHALHLNKALANTLAIPSILLKRTIRIEEHQDYSSIVKELFSVWTKDALPNVLATTSASRAELQQLKAFATEHAAPVMTHQLQALLTQLEDGLPHLVNPGAQENLAWRNFTKNSYSTVDQHTLGHLLAQAPALTASPDYDTILALVQTLHASMDGDGELIDGAGATLDPDDEVQAEAFVQLQADYDTRSQRLNQLVNAATVATSRHPLLATIEATVEREIANTIALIDSEVVVHPAPERVFGNENYGGDQPGLRRDTHVAQPTTRPAPHADADADAVQADNAIRQKDLLNVLTEFRSGEAMNNYLNSDEA
jgi:hypothetical protein